jgi:putative redox protein
VVVDSPAPDDAIERVKQAVDRHCPVLDDLRSPTPVELAWRRASRATRSS